MQTPKDIDVVSVFVSTNGVPKFDYLGRVLPNGTVALPATLAVVEPDSPTAQVRVRVTGFQETNARVLRDVLTTVPQGQTSLLRLPLNFLDDGSAMGSLPTSYVPLGVGGTGGPNAAPEGDTAFDPTTIRSRCDFDATQRTSINGKCVSALLDSSKLPPYAPSQVYGDGGLMANGAPVACFNAESCFELPSMRYGHSPLPRQSVQRSSSGARWRDRGILPARARGRSPARRRPDHRRREAP